MSNKSKNPKASEIERYADNWAKFLTMENVANISKTEKKKDYKEKRAKVLYNNFISSGDYHYFVARTIFLLGYGVYGFYCAQQSLENYLKAYLTFKKTKYESKHETHDLLNLLNYCIEVAPKKSFLRTRRAQVIVTRFDPFNELPRYPVYKRGPEGGYALVHPIDIYPLDYFIYRIRKEMRMPNGGWDVFKEGKPFDANMIEKDSLVMNIFKQDNINF